MKLILCFLVFMVVISCDVRIFLPLAVFIYLAGRLDHE
jgi:hypothetical protein